MPLFVELKSGSSIAIPNDQNPEIYLDKNGYHLNEIASVGANQLELDYIRAEFRNIPDNPGLHFLKWYGEIARFILSNWK